MEAPNWFLKMSVKIILPKAQAQRLDEMRYEKVGKDLDISLITTGLHEVEYKDLSTPLDIIRTTIEPVGAPDAGYSKRDLALLQVLTCANFARCLTDHPADFTEVALALFDKSLRPRARVAHNSQMTAAYAVVDALDLAIHDDAEHWADFDVKFEELKRLLTTTPDADHD
jgi:hypothetical protein